MNGSRGGGAFLHNKTTPWHPAGVTIGAEINWGYRCSHATGPLANIHIPRSAATAPRTESAACIELTSKDDERSCNRVLELPRAGIRPAGFGAWMKSRGFCASPYVPTGG